jgi:cysteine desulfurase/selenocysteine lyase
VFTKSATEGINLVAFGLAWSLKPGDEILISEIEHHANLVPWQQLALRTGATLKWFKELPDGRLDVDPSLITERTKIVAVTGQSNVTGVIPPLREIGELAHSVGALFLVDGAQLVPHHPVNVADLGADFLAFSGHKMLGPLGLGVLYGKYAALDALPPFLTGGSMIEVVRMEETTFLPPPARFEPGVPAVSLAAGLGAAIDYLTELGMDNVAAHEEALTAHALSRRSARSTACGSSGRSRPRTAAAPSRSRWRASTRTTSARCSTSSASRSGPATTAPGRCTGLGCQASNRASFYLYNTHAEVDALADGIRYARSSSGSSGAHPGGDPRAGTVRPPTALDRRHYAA